MNTHINAALDRKVSRQEFMALSCVALGSIFGLGPLLKLLTEHNPAPSAQALPSSGGYGNSSYGG